MQSIAAARAQARFGWDLINLDVTIMDDQGTLLPGGQTGEVVVRGTAVMGGYDGDPAATKAAFAGDWFKTGDVGYFDADGYLFLTGRIREMINRGGEKVTPQEVEAILLQHPAVADAVTFAVPHPTLGEDVASAIVLRPGVAATPNDIRQFAIGRIADFKVPRQVVIVKEIPKGPTGKVQRIGLADKLGLASGTKPRQASWLRELRSKARWRSAGRRSFGSSRSAFTMTSSRRVGTLSGLLCSRSRLRHDADRARGLAISSKPRPWRRWRAI
jgi:acyl-CoA synthetase (AMP-forming)/AMP-acid ligase II